MSASNNARRGIPSLDGLRAVSILVVLLGHAGGTRGFPNLPRWLWDHGALGVQIFFVISGFLITTLLLKEREKTGRISLKLFYARRTLRIFPPFYVFVAVIAVGSWAGIIVLPKQNLLFALTYTMNFAPNGFWYTGHLWSLSVEEQFYLLWPLTLSLAGLNRSLTIASALVIASPLFCMALALAGSPWLGPVSHWFPLIADSIASGCVLAILLPRWRTLPRVKRALAAPAGFLAFPLIWLLDLSRDHPRLYYGGCAILLNASICYILARYMEFPHLSVGRVLNSVPLRFIGRLSYSLYLWQQLFMSRFSTGFLHMFPVNVAASFAVAWLSYLLLEKPFERLRQRLQPLKEKDIGRAPELAALGN